MLTWIIFAGVVAVTLTLTLIGLLRVRHHLIARVETLTPYTEQHGHDLEERLERLVDTSHAQTSMLQESLEALRSGRRHENE